MLRTLPFTILACLLSACHPAGREQADNAGSRVDSILPMDVMLDRFRAGLDHPTHMASGMTNRDSLVAALIHALSTQDTAAFEPLTVTRAEWAWLYFPTDILSRPPYELPPGLAWFQLQETNRKGALRLFRELGGDTLTLDSYHCRPDPMVEDANRIWTGCLVTLHRNGGAAETIRLFSAILERDGRYAFLSFDNDY